MLLVPIRTSSDSLDGLYALNATASDIWDWAVAGCSPEQIAERLSGKYCVDYSVALEDARQMLMDLVAIGALRARKRIQ